jgi:hypothetical protein
MTRPFTKPAPAVGVVVLVRSEGTFVEEVGIAGPAGVVPAADVGGTIVDTEVGPVVDPVVELTEGVVVGTPDDDVKADDVTVVGTATVVTVIGIDVTGIDVTEIAVTATEVLDGAEVDSWPCAYAADTVADPLRAANGFISTEATKPVTTMSEHRLAYIERPTPNLDSRTPIVCLNSPLCSWTFRSVRGAFGWSCCPELA